MGRERKSNPRKMRPQFLVLCEGETEEAYINFLKQRYRLPIKIVPKVIGCSLSQKKIKQYQNELTANPSELRTFFMYDGDVPEVLNALRKCEGTMLITKPCIEIWFIAHHKKVPEKEFSSDACVKHLCSLPYWQQYKKAFLTLNQQDFLWDNRGVAVANMNKKTEENKTYSTIYRLIEILEIEKNK